jgi:hypothetical protein
MRLIISAIACATFASLCANAKTNRKPDQAAEVTPEASASAAAASSSEANAKTESPPSPTPPVSEPPAPEAKTIKPPSDPTKDRIGKVTQVFRDTQKAIVQLEGGADASSTKSVVVSTGPGEACEAMVVSIIDQQMLVQFSGCAGFDKVRANSIVSRNPFEAVEEKHEEPKLVQPVAPAAQPSEVENASETALNSAYDHNRPRVVLSFGFNSGTEYKYNDFDYYSGGSFLTGEYTLEVDPAFHFALGVMVARKHSWGAYVGISRESKRNVNSETVSINGITMTSTITGEKPSFTNTLLEFNSLYRWDQFYLPFGLNYSILSFSPADAPANWTFEAEGSMGAQVGFGVFANDNVHFEFYTQVITNTLEITTPTETFKFNTGFMAGAMARVGVNF